jgi:hypothetical protein
LISLFVYLYAPCVEVIKNRHPFAIAAYLLG